ncbi:hypothetical protein F66182_7358 [Fusarium sp. NRRL 66182]|nr:hypothetical protein F66182_7358 [Fusarium sp. NRRL 66182]
MPSWNSLPIEISSFILEKILTDTEDHRIAPYAAVSREWQDAVEKKTFRFLRVNQEALPQLEKLSERHARLVKYVILAVELPTYNCWHCRRRESFSTFLENTAMIESAIVRLFTIMTKWKPAGELKLEINVYSLSDTAHWFRYCYFGVPGERRSQGHGETIPFVNDVQVQNNVRLLDDPRHWIPGENALRRPFQAAHVRFEASLPSLPAVTKFVLRRQCRRQISPEAISHLWSKLPCLEEIIYEPWHLLEKSPQDAWDEYYEEMVRENIPDSVKRIVFFEDFNENYLVCFRDSEGLAGLMKPDRVRITTPAVGAALAERSLRLESVSVSFLVDAAHFFNARQPHWRWDQLRFLHLTSRLMTPSNGSAEINELLQTAGRCAIRMPKLEVLTLWNGARGEACAFTYRQQDASLTWRASWDLELKDSVFGAWKKVAYKYSRHEFHVKKEAVKYWIESHAHAIEFLGLDHVVDDVSLVQILAENRRWDNPLFHFDSSETFVGYPGYMEEEEGPAGLTALKNLREEGFDAVAFERRDSVGGLWAYSENPEYTTALDDTITNVSKFVSGFSDFPIPKECPTYLSRKQAQEYFESYASHFGLHRHIRFGITVHKVLRNTFDDGWDVYTSSSSGEDKLFFDKIVLANGCESIPVWPSMSGREKYKGTVIHAQEYRSYKINDLEGKKVMVVGIGNTGCEIALSLCKYASKTYLAYRRGRILLSRYDDDGVPTDSQIPWPMLRLKYLLDYYVPWLTKPLVDRLMIHNMIQGAAKQEPASGDVSEKERFRRAERKVGGEWRMVPCPSLAHKHPAVQEDIFPAFHRKDIIPVHGFVEFAEENSVLLADGASIDVDVVIFATGYRHDFSIMPELEMDGAAGMTLKISGELERDKERDDQRVPHLPRLFQMIFPPRWASSVAFLSWMAPQENVWCVSELASMAVAQAWAAETAQKRGQKAPEEYRPASLLPPQEKMNQEVDSYQSWWRKEWATDHSVLHGYVRAYSFYRFLHDMAGTGLYEYLDHPFSMRGWWLWWNDHDLWKWISMGPLNSYSWRLFETNPLGIPGRGRKAWTGARKALEEAYLAFYRFKTGRKKEN